MSTQTTSGGGYMQVDFPLRARVGGNTFRQVRWEKQDGKMAVSLEKEVDMCYWYHMYQKMSMNKSGEKK